MVDDKVGSNDNLEDLTITLTQILELLVNLLSFYSSNELLPSVC